jgi:sulfate adenylyltransferase
VEAADLTMQLGPDPAPDLRPRAADERRLQPAQGLPERQADYDSVVENMRLADGTLWPMPITLDVTEAFADTVEIGQDIALRDQEGVILAT